MSLLTGLVSAWELDESSGTRFDSHGSNDLTDNNTVGSATGLVYGAAADFERDNSEYLSRASNADLQAGDIDFTFEVWVKPESLAATGNTIVGKDTDTGRDYTLDMVDGFPRFYIAGGGGTAQATWGQQLTPGVWYQIIGWHDAANDLVGIVANAGVPVTAATGGAAPPVSSTEFNLGSRRYPGFEDYFDGVLGPVRFWKRLLTADERTALYNGGAGLAYSAFAPTPVTVTGDIVQAADTASGSASLRVTATGAATQAGDACAASAAVAVSALMSALQAGDALAGTAALTVGTSGAPVGTGDTASGSTAVAVGASGSLVQAGDTLTGTVVTDQGETVPGGVFRRALATWSRAVARRLETWDRRYRRALPTWSRVWRYDPMALPTEAGDALIAAVSDDRDYGFDCSRAPELVGDGVTIASGEILGGAGLEFGAPAVLAEAFDDIPAGKGLTVRISGGAANTVYKLACLVTLSNGRKLTVPGRMRKVSDFEA